MGGAERSRRTHRARRWTATTAWSAPTAWPEVRLARTVARLHSMPWRCRHLHGATRLPRGRPLSARSLRYRVPSAWGPLASTVDTIAECVRIVPAVYDPPVVIVAGTLLCICHGNDRR